ncbi:hypothetical protein [Streptomyces sp. NPDC051567]
MVLIALVALVLVRSCLVPLGSAPFVVRGPLLYVLAAPPRGQDGPPV